MSGGAMAPLAAGAAQDRWKTASFIHRLVSSLIVGRHTVSASVVVPLSLPATSLVHPLSSHDLWPSSVHYANKIQQKRTMFTDARSLPHSTNPEQQQQYATGTCVMKCFRATLCQHARPICCFGTLFAS